MEMEEHPPQLEEARQPPHRPLRNVRFHTSVHGWRMVQHGWEWSVRSGGLL